ncbi:MAG: VanZ family protein [Bacilli bacterium]
MIADIVTNTLKGSWPMLTIFIVVLAGVRIIKLVDNGEKIVFYEEFLNLFFIIYALILYKLLTNTEGASSGLNFMPFREILRYKFGTTLFYYNVIGNILIFIPFGYFVSRHVNAKRASHILILTAIISGTVEMVQYNIGRAFDIDDIILNVFGSLIGFFLYIALTAIQNHLPKFLRRDAFYNIICIIIIIIVAIYVTRILGLGWF